MPASFFEEIAKTGLAYDASPVFGLVLVRTWSTDWMGLAFAISQFMNLRKLFVLKRLGQFEKLQSAN